MMEVAANEGSTPYKKRGGRRYVFCTDQGFACWLNEASWRYEMGNASSSQPLLKFDHVDPTIATLITASYDINTNSLFACLYQNGTSDINKINNFSYPNGVGPCWSILCDSSGNTQFSGYWRGILTTAKKVEKKGN